MSNSRNQNYGQEITFNNWQINYQNFIRLILLSLACGLAIALIWFGLFALKNSFEALNLYWYSWVYCHIPFGCSENAIYNLRVLQPTIDQLNGLFASCWTVFCLGTVTSAIAFQNYFAKKGKALIEEKFIRGSKLLKPEILKAEVNKVHPETDFDIFLGREQIRIPEHLTYRHFALSGASGTGKTQAINSLLRQLEAEPNQKVLILDLNGQYYSRFGRDGDFVLSLYDKRSEPWNFWAENAPPEFFAEALIEQGKNDKFFAPAGRALLSDLLRMNDSIEGLFNDLCSLPEFLLAKLMKAGGISPSLLGAPEQAAGVMSTAGLKLNFLRHLNYWADKNKEPFSLTNWATSTEVEGWTFLIVRDEDLAAAKPLMRVWFDLATLGILQRDENQAYPHIWLIADELSGLGELPTLGKLLSQGRKYQASAVCGYQTSGQIENTFGRDGAKEIFQGLQNKVIYRCNDADTARHGSRELGDQEVEELNRGIQFGSNPISDRNNLNRGIKLSPVVMPAELQNLPDLHAYIKLCHFDPTQIHFDYQPHEPINPATDCEIPPNSPKPNKPKDNNKPPADPPRDLSSTENQTNQTKKTKKPKQTKKNNQSDDLSTENKSNRTKRTKKPKQTKPPENPYDSDPINPDDFLNF